MNSEIPTVTELSDLTNWDTWASANTSALASKATSSSVSTNTADIATNTTSLSTKVDLSSAQEISGQKTFQSATNFHGGVVNLSNAYEINTHQVSLGSVVSGTDLEYCASKGCSFMSSNQTISGVKTHSVKPAFNAGYTVESDVIQRNASESVQGFETVCDAANSMKFRFIDENTDKVSMMHRRVPTPQTVLHQIP